jgi:hypothetical protein
MSSTLLKLRSLTIRNVWRLLAAAIALTACVQERKTRQAIADIAAVELTQALTLVSTDSVPFQEETFGATFAAQNRLILPNPRELTVAVFDSLGRQTAFVGGRGEGPGSLTGLSAAFLFGDTLAVFDNNRLKVYFFLDGRLAGPSLDFSLWPRGGDERVRLVGRFGDGRWVAIHVQRQDWPPSSVHEYADTTLLVVGQPEAVPATWLRLPVQTRLRVSQGNSTFLIALADVAPASVSVCDSGIVVLDSSGVKYFDTHGRITANIDLQRTKIPFGAVVGDGIIRLQMTGIPPGAIADETRRIIHKHLARIARVLPPTLLDLRGQIWLMHRASLEYQRVDRLGSFDFAFKANNSILAIGEGRVLTTSIDPSTDLPSYNLLKSHSPVGNRPPSLGWCQGAAAW